MSAGYLGFSLSAVIVHTNNKTLSQMTVGKNLLEDIDVKNVIEIFKNKSN